MKQLDNNIGIIAGQGSLPKQIVNGLIDHGMKPYVAALKGIAEKNVAEGVDAIWGNVTAVGKIIGFFRDNNVKQLVLAGGMKRPSFSSLIPDGTGLKLLNRLRKLDEAGDGKMFDEIISFLEENGFEVLCVDEVVPEMVTAQGVMGEVSPSKNNMNDVEYGKYIAEEVGRLDIGQSIIVQNRVTLGVEGIDGTDALLTRYGPLQFDGHGAILVKIRKPKQDRRIDLPAIGPRTIELLHEFRYKGVALKAGDSLIIEREQTLARAKELGIFIYGF